MYKNWISRFFFASACFLFLLNISCRKDLDFESNPNVNLRFSKDTVFLDTIFTKNLSETFLLKVYNDSDDDVLISSIQLNQKENSPYRINVDGNTGFEFNEIPLRGKDSLMIFVNLYKNQYDDLIAEDEILFNQNAEIKLLAAVENAQYYYPVEGENQSFIKENTIWNPNQSYVIYGDLIVSENQKLEILAGTKIYFHQKSKLQINPGAELLVSGEKGKKVIVRGDRHTPRYDTLPQLWNSIMMMPKSNINAKYLQIKSATTGLAIDNATAKLENIEIYNSGSSGIWAKNANVTGKNVVISDAANAALNIEHGGIYHFYFSSFANNWENGVANVSGPNIPLYLSDYFKDGEEITTNNLEANFYNCIFYGRYPNGAVLDFENKDNAKYSFESCLIKNEDKSSIDYSKTNGFNHILTENPLFISTIFSQQDLRLQENSPARNQGNAFYNLFAPFDFNQKNRDITPNLGAFE